jgi:DNA-binding transcriptional regulator YhcF (GntR family)
MENNGWISLHRKLLDNPIASKSDYMNLWVHLLLMANHEETSFIWNNKKQILKPGQLLTGRKQLSLDTGIAESQVYKILNYLEKEQQIEQQKTTKYTIITILNWANYQNKEHQKEQQSNNRVTTERQQSNTYNNDNNDNNTTKVGRKSPAGYGNPDINKFLKGVNKHLEVKLPEDGKSRQIGRSCIMLLEKYDSKGIVKEGRDFMNDDKWENAKDFLYEYVNAKISKGYNPQSWYKVLDNLKLWIANKGVLEMPPVKK